jgi:hypothetical protein
MNSDAFRWSRLWTTLSMTIAVAIASGCGTADGGQASLPGQPSGGAPSGVDPPSFSFRSGESPGSVQVAISSAAPGAEIFYELVLDVPLTTSSRRYSGPVALTPRALYEDSMSTVRAIAVVGGEASPEAAATYLVPMPPDPTPTFSPGTGTYSTSQRVTISSSVPAATIWYTVDGTEPRWGASRVYTGPIPVDGSTTVRAIATLHNDVTPVATATYLF